MRTGGYTVQQTLTSEAALVLKNSLNLARRRNHAQVTPLHVAATLLTSRTSTLLRRACLKSHPHPTSHPLQCRALELCFNVALNRLPNTPTPILHNHPCLSNALIAALKRAQAHQRRGSIEQQQQQPLIAVKVELEQLIVSILDDPSVSRVMKEAGFSSTSVKNNLEGCSSISSLFQSYSSPSSPTETHREILINPTSFWQTHLMNSFSEQNPFLFSPPKKDLSGENEEDLKLVFDVMLRQKRRNIVLVGDNVVTTEGMVTELMRRVEKCDVPDELKSACFVKCQFSSMSLRFMKREDVERKVADLIRNLALGGGVIIYVGDLKWTIETGLNERDIGLSLGDVSNYSPVDHLVAEFGKLITDYSCSNSKIWLIGTASYQTSMRCQMKQPPLEIQWGLQDVFVPSGGLGSSLHVSSDLDSRMTLSQTPPQKLEDKLNCCAECSLNFEKDAVFFNSGLQKTSSLLSSCVIEDKDKDTTNLPSWLQPYRAETRHKDNIADLRRRWNSLCHSLHNPRPNQIQSSSSLFNKRYCAPSYPWLPTRLQYNHKNTYPDSSYISFAESIPKLECDPNCMVQFGSQKSCSTELGLNNGTHNMFQSVLSLNSLKNENNKDMKDTLALGNPMFSDSVISLNQNGGLLETDWHNLTKILQENVPWQSDIIPSIAEALLNSKSKKRNGTWFLLKGTDWIGKRRLGRVIAKSLCGSIHNFIRMNMRRDNESIPCSEILKGALQNHKKCVVLIEDFHYSNSPLVKFLLDSFKDNIEEQSRIEVSFPQPIFILTTSDSTSYDDSIKEADNVIQMKLLVEESQPTNMDLKRKSQWGESNKTKSPRTSQGEEKTLFVKDLSRQSSSSTLDLNIQAEEEDEDQTQESAKDLKTPSEFLESVENIFVLNQNPAKFDELIESYKSNLECSFKEVYGSEGSNYFFVDREVLEEIVVGTGSFLGSLFENWLKDIFQTSLQAVKNGGKDGIIRLSLGGKEEKVVNVGFMGSNLPGSILIASKD